MKPGLMRKPEGVRVTVAVRVAKPGALAVRSTVPVPSRAWMKNDDDGLKKPTLNGTVICAVPRVVPLFDRRTLFGSVLVITTFRPPEGAGASRLSEPASCRSLPMV